MKAGRIIYITIGLLFLTASITCFVWFYDEFLYLISNPRAYTSLVRFLIFLITLLFGIFYFYLGIKSYKINWLSNVSLLLLVTTFMSSMLLIFGFDCFIFLFSSRACPDYYVLMRKIADSLLIYGTLASAFLSVISLFLRRKIV